MRQSQAIEHAAELSDYVLKPIRKDEEFVLYRGEQLNQVGASTVLVLAPLSNRPALESIRKIEHEYELRHELDSAWAVRPLALSPHRGETMLVLEDPGGETLDRLLSKPMEITQFLRLAAGLATALSGLHKCELIHKDVKPANVLVNSVTGEIRLMGFGIASRLPRERQPPEAPEFIAGTLPYMAPEQTGRMNRSIDSRSDLYSLGVTLYEMLTGALPFTASDPMEMFEEIVGTSKALHHVLSHTAKVAPTDSTVLITGETGTGKELIARAVHKRSRRAERAFVSVNCAALAPSLISSELFGHEKGAFTGATQRRLGRFELADGGTIFLDEVGELPLETQVALLRVLQEREFERIGGTQSIQVDVRVIAATNRDLTTAIANGTFRQDLFYRLNVFPIEVPPLRKRTDDILLLVQYFVQRYAKRAGKNIQSIDKKTIDLFRSYDWPGNIRELQNIIERSVILTSSHVLSVDESWLSKEPSAPLSQVRGSLTIEGEQLEERKIIEAALAESRGRVYGPMGAAARLEMPPSTLRSKIKSLNIRKGSFKYR